MIFNVKLICIKAKLLNFDFPKEHTEIMKNDEK